MLLFVKKIEIEGPLSIKSKKRLANHFARRFYAKILHSKIILYPILHGFFRLPNPIFCPALL
jgi:hypothetical protein